jgi:hypothetical protein
MKWHVLVSVLSIISASHMLCACPCNASKEDPRPFFEQYDEHDKKSSTNANNYDTQEKKKDSTNATDKVEKKYIRVES